MSNPRFSAQAEEVMRTHPALTACVTEALLAIGCRCPAECNCAELEGYIAAPPTIREDLWGLALEVYLSPDRSIFAVREEAGWGWSGPDEEEVDDRPVIELAAAIRAALKGSRDSQ